MRFVLDTNVLIDGIQDDFSAQHRLLEAVRSGRVEAVATPQIVREYNLLVSRRIHDPSYKKSIQEFISSTTRVSPKEVEEVTIDDEQDKKFLAAAAGGRTDAIVTSDKHLLDIGELGATRIITPAEAWRQVEEEGGGNSTWRDFIKGLGIGLCLAALASTAAPTVHAAEPSVEAINESVKQLSARQEEISSKEDEIKQLEKKISGLKDKRDTTAADAELISAQVKRLSTQLKKAELELKQITASISLTSQQKDETEAAVKDLGDKLDTKRQQLAALLQLLYEQEQESFIRIFFDTLSLSDVLAQRAAYEELQDRTIELVLAMRQEAAELAAKKQELEQQYQQLQTLEETVSVQQDEITAHKKEQQAFLQAKKEEQLKYEQKIAEVEAAKKEISQQIFTLKDSGVQLSLTNAFDMARLAGKLTNVRPALLLAVLKVESNLGANVGSGRYPDDMHPGSRDAFLRITKKLGLDPNTTPVARKPRSGRGWGGAMGPAQIMPATWEGIEPRIAQLLGKSTSNPYELTDAFVATAIFLADRGAANPAQEFEAVNKYIAGPYWQFHTWYGERVLAVAAEYAKQGL